MATPFYCFSHFDFNRLSVKLQGNSIHKIKYYFTKNILTLYKNRIKYTIDLTGK